MDLELKNKVFIVAGGAGAAGSIGHTIVTTFVDEGAVPVIIDISLRGADYVADFKSNDQEAAFFRADLTNPGEVEAAIQEVVKKYDRIDGVVNVVGGNDGVGLEASSEDFLDSIKLNLLSYFHTVKYALPALRRSKGTVLNIGSKVALTGQGGTSAYAAAKGGVLALTREWAIDLINDGIRVNAVVIAECWTPSYKTWLDTLDQGDEKHQAILDKIPLEHRMTTPQEVADTVAFLISPRSSHTTGQQVFVDGGYVHLDRAMLGRGQQEQEERARARGKSNSKKDDIKSNLIT